MWLYAKVAIAVVLAILLVLAGAKVNGWRLESQAAEVLRLELRNELQRRVAEQVRAKEAETARLEAEAKLTAKEEEIAKGVKTVKETVVKYVKQNAECDLPEPVASQLQHLRSGGEQ